ncbi:hypothetical protein [Halpernia frigidisoli]|uniref:Uncharacterized protein n=1 Tax=Halpernia frigidisoli TaxID=1125876 RepID=A0A1I3GHK7_9FLAO|nr:hypothetical protein [Halpernia frigidisoli]SFI22917.1 hypothetical protein SAMN05443292_1847 [Halpernia frigidisoli]
MKNQRSLQRFSPLKQKIDELKKNNSRFKRVYKEYEFMSDELWDMETSLDISVSDDFLNAVTTQTNYLEEEIDGWLKSETDQNPI